MEIIRKTFSCMCGGEGLLFTKFVDDIDKEIYMAIYTVGQFNLKPSILDRLKYCWYHLKTGKKYEDEIILTFDEAQDVANWLIENTKK